MTSSCVLCREAVPILECPLLEISLYTKCQSKQAVYVRTCIPQSTIILQETCPRGSTVLKAGYTVGPPMKDTLGTTYINSATSFFVERFSSLEGSKCIVSFVERFSSLEGSKCIMSFVERFPLWKVQNVLCPL